jgi:2,3-bisphosphoglycerate-independent phosphoglycerate mutase
MKFLFLVADGMGDWPLAALDGQTPLEAAPTPNMDELARTGVVGRCRTVPEGLPPGSDVANMSLLGFDPAVHHTGRGPIEAAAQGLTLDPDDLVWRMNLVRVSEFTPDGIMEDYSSGHITTEVSAPLVRDLEAMIGDEIFSFHPGVQYRHLLVQKGGAAEDEAAIKVRPPHDITDRPIRPDMLAFSKSARLWDLVHLAAERLGVTARDCRANAVWPWGQGRPLTLSPFDQRFGMRGMAVSAVDLIRGLGRAMSMEVPEIPGATGLLDTNYEGKVAAALEFLDRGGEFAFVHVEAPDECGHAGNVADKVESVARFDARIVAPLREALKGQDVAWIVTCDHYTPIAEKTHTPDPVPFLLHYPGCAASGVECFSEKTAGSSGVVLERGHELLDWALERMRGAR